MNAILSRDLIGHLRAPRLFLGFFLILILAGVSFCSAYYNITKKQYVAAQDSRTLVFPLVFSALFLTLPVLTMSAGSLAREREIETLDLILTTPIRPGSILFVKFVAGFISPFFPMTSPRYRTSLLTLCCASWGLS